MSQCNTNLNGPKRQRCGEPELAASSEGAAPSVGPDPAPCSPCKSPLESLPPDLLDRIAYHLPGNDVACTLRLLSRTLAAHFRSHTTVRLSQPVPHHAFVRRFGRWSAVRSLPLAQRRKLIALTAASGSVANLRVVAGGPGVTRALGSAGCTLTAEVFRAAAAAGELAMCKELYDMGCPWDASVVEAAARGGHVGVVRSLVLSGCPWVFPDAAVRCGSAAVVAELCRLWRNVLEYGPVTAGGFVMMTGTGDSSGTGASSPAAAEEVDVVGGGAQQLEQLLHAALQDGPPGTQQSTEQLTRWQARWVAAAMHVPLAALQQLLGCVLDEPAADRRQEGLAAVNWRWMLEAALLTPDDGNGSWRGKADWLHGVLQVWEQRRQQQRLPADPATAGGGPPERLSLRDRTTSEQNQVTEPAPQPWTAGGLRERLAWIRQRGYRLQLPPPGLLPLGDAAAIGELVAECLAGLESGALDGFRWDSWRQLWQAAAAGGHLQTLGALEALRPQLAARLATAWQPPGNRLATAWQPLELEVSLPRAELGESDAVQRALAHDLGVAAAEGAAGAGRLDVLTWLLERHLVSALFAGGRLWTGAAKSKATGVMQFLVAHDYSCLVTDDDVLQAVKDSYDPQVVAWVCHARGFGAPGEAMRPVPEDAMVAAASHAELPVLEVLRAAGGSLSSSRVAGALAKRGSIAVMAWAARHGCVFEREHVKVAIGEGCAPVIEWLLAHIRGRDGEDVVFMADTSGMDEDDELQEGWGLWDPALDSGDAGTLHVLLQNRGANRLYVRDDVSEWVGQQHSMPFLVFVTRHGEARSDSGFAFPQSLLPWRHEVEAEEDVKYKEFKDVLPGSCDDATMVPALHRWVQRAGSLLDHRRKLSAARTSARELQAEHEETPAGGCAAAPLAAMVEAAEAAHQAVAAVVDNLMAQVVLWVPEAEDGGGVGG
ncbi:hypothetical protein HYH02_010706 [Chlamydomonas schloesseri]|uniref:F-box domain-containing protein n=1 Tax=Chlamydomonas schloesseri TaxID=2026947 RepID=A0A835W7W4_9CHLO|nr:hypothetical protein HYH02_010706 [Chlamydomonas schloesseri]|eukprot:KAG2438911.1 hypothetical protein HYH02_010706 [Chlamydomonas schloesseri]